MNKIELDLAKKYCGRVAHKWEGNYREGFIFVLPLSGPQRCWFFPDIVGGKATCQPLGNNFGVDEKLNIERLKNQTRESENGNSPHEIYYVVEALRIARKLHEKKTSKKEEARLFMDARIFCANLSIEKVFPRDFTLLGDYSPKAAS